MPKCTLEKAEKSSDVTDEGVEKENQGRREQLGDQLRGCWANCLIGTVMGTVKIQRKRKNESYLPKQGVCMYASVCWETCCSRSLPAMVVWLL